LKPSGHERRLSDMHDERTASNVIGSFDEVILPHLDAAHNFAHWLMRNSDDAEDVTQEAFLRAFRYFGTFRGGNARAWLLRIVRTTSFTWLNKNRVRQFDTEFDEELHAGTGEAFSPEALLLNRADAQMVEQAIRQLPDRSREVLILREREGLSYREIADVIGVPMGTVMSTLSRARERFAHALNDLLSRQVPKGRSDVSETKLEETNRDVVLT